MARRHNDANTVTLSGARLAPDEADAIVERFLRTAFEGGRHARRVGQIAELDGSAVRSELTRRGPLVSSGASRLAPREEPTSGSDTTRSAARLGTPSEPTKEPP